MADSVIGALKVEISVDAQGVKDGIKASGKALQIGSKQLRKSANEWAKWGAAAAAAAATASAALIKSNLSSIRELKFLSQAANTTVKDFQQMAFGAQQFGIEQEKLGDILKDVNDRVGDFITTGGGPMADFFEQIGPKIGVTIDDFKKLSGPEALQLYVSSLEKANVSQQEMTFFMEAMASDSTRLLPLLRENGKLMSEQAAAAEALGIGLTKVDVEKAAEAQRVLDAIASVSKNELMKATAELAPVIAEIGKRYISAAEDAGGFAQYTINGLRTVSRAVAVFADGIHGIGIAFNALEVVARGVNAAIFTGIEELVKAVIGTGNTILEGWRLIFKQMADMARPLSDDVAEMFDSAASGVNSLKATVPQFIRDLGESQRQALAGSIDALREATQEKIPSEVWDEFLNDVLVKSTETGKKIKKAITPTPAGDDKEPDKVAKFQEETIGLLEAMGLRYSSQEELQLAAFDREKAMLDGQLARREITKEQHSKKMSEIERKQAEATRKIQVDNLQQGFQALASNSKKVQKVLQAAAIARAVIAGKDAAVQAWDAGMSTGGPWAPVVAASYTAASIAKTGAMIKSIKSGGSSVGGGGGGAGVVGAPQQQAQQQQPPQQEVNRSINVNFANEGLLSTEQVRGVIGQINEQLGDGVTLNVSPAGG